MRKLIVFILFIAGGMSVKAQFPTTDSLRSFINRYIRNSAVEAFQNLRLNTALIGISNYLDSTYGGQVKSFTAANDSTARLITIANDTMDVVIRAAGPTVTLTNIGTGYSFVATPGGSIKRLNPGYGFLADSTTAANSITIRADTSSTNHLITQNDLNDTAAVLRAAIGTGGGGSADSATYSTNYRRDTAIANVRTQIAGKQPTGNYITALTGDVTASGPGSVAATIAANAVSNSKLRQSAGLSVIGNSTNSTANVADITAGTDNQVLRRNGTAIGFGAVNLASSNAVTGVLPLGNLDTTSTNRVVTQSDLNDTAAVLRAAMGSGGSGEVNTASNVGSGTGIFKTKSGVDLQFKSLTSPYGILYTSNTNDVGIIPDTASSNGVATRNKLNDTARVIRARYNLPRTESYGIIYHKDKFTTASDLTPVGAFSGIYNTGAIAISGGDGSFNNYATVGGYTLLPQWSITTRRKVNVVNGTSYGFGQGVKSTNTNGMFDVLGRIETATGTAGNLVLNNSSGTPLNTGSGPSISAGDEVEITLSFNDSVVTFSARNITTSSSTSSISYAYSTSSPSGIYVPNTAKFALFEFGGSDSLKAIDIRSTTPRNPNVLYLTDSKGIYFAQYWATRTGKLLNATYPTVVSYNGGSDGTLETLAKLPEITRLNPAQVILNIGSNRLRFGGTLTQAVTEYDSIVRFFANANIPVYHVVLPEDSTGGGIGMSAFKQWVAATYASNYIDVWNPLSTSNILKAGYKGDDVHPNQAAMKSIDSLITLSGKLVNTNDRTYQFRTSDANIGMIGDSLYFAGTTGGGSGSGITGLTTNAIPKATSSTTVGDGSITDGASLTTLSNAAIINSTFKAGASTAADDAPITVANPSTLPSLSFYRATSGTDEKIWNWYVDATNMYMRTVNDAKSADATAVQFHRSGNSIDYVRLNGNVGIGKSPSFKLDVDGAGYFNGNVTNIGLFTSTGSGAGFAVHRRDTDANAWGIVSMAGGLDFYDQGVADFRFNILSNGKLHIYDTVQADARMSYNSNVHGSFTRYSLVDKAYVDSVVAAVSGGSGITSINSETGSSQTIAAGTGVSVNTTTNTHTISLNTSYITAGTYTPTLTGVTNVTGTTAYACQYMRVGNVVTVSGKLNIDFTSTGLTEVGISLPIASSISNDFEVAGTGATGENTISGAILGDAANNRAHFAFQTGSSAGYNFFFTFTYQIL